MKVAILSPVAWRTPPQHYGPWEQSTSNIAESLIEQGVDVTLFATQDSITRGKLEGVCSRGYEEDTHIDPKVWEYLHISHLMEQADRFDLIHNNFDFMPLTYSRLIKTPMITTIRGFSSPKIIPVYKKYNSDVNYVSISNANRHPELNYIATVYNGLNISLFTLNLKHADYLLFFGRIHWDKGTHEAIQIAQKAGRKLIIAGIIQDESYFNQKVKPYLNDRDVVYVGSVGPKRRNELLGGAYAMLHPINFEEPFGNSVAESMLCGTPVIAFKRGSMPELIRHQKTGFLVNSIREAVDVMDAIPRINRLHCRQWAESQFSREKMAKDYLVVYAKILKSV